MRSTIGMLRKVLVKAVLVASLFALGLAFADPGSSPRPGGGYVEPVIFQPITLDGDFTGGGGAFGPLPMF